MPGMVAGMCRLALETAVHLRTVERAVLLFVRGERSHLTYIFQVNFKTHFLL